MSQFMKTTGGRYGMHSGSAKYKNLEVVNRLNVAGNEVPILPMNGDVFYVDKTVTASGDGRSWKFAFKTVTEGLAALQDYDTLIIGPGNYDETDNLSLDDVKGVKIFGHGNGMQWGEGSTCIRNVVATTKDILDIGGCQGIEIAGINFIQIGAYDAINFDALCYSVEIHDCGFIATAGAGTGLYGIHDIDESNSPDLYIHHCRFLGWKTAAIMTPSQRYVITNNYFVVPASGKGIYGGNPASGFGLIADNDFLGANSSDYGIYDEGGTRGNFMISGNRFANFASATGYGILFGTGDYNCVENYRADAAGAVTPVDPEQ